MNGFHLKIVTPQRTAAGIARVTADGQTRQAETGPGVLTVTHEGTTLLCERFEWK